MPDTSPRFSRCPKLLVASAEFRGSYTVIGLAMEELAEWLDMRGIKYAGDPFCMFYDNPGETPESQLRSEACIPVSTPFQPEGKFKLKELSEVDVAETRHEGPPEKFAMTYGPFLESLIRSGYKLLGPTREYFTKVSDVKGPGTGYLIQQPISKR